MTKVVVRNLGREKAYGQAFPDRKLIEIDPRQRPKQYLSTLLHEAIHVSMPDLSEAKVKKLERELRDVIWNHNYRWVDL